MYTKKNILIVQPTFNSNEARNIRTENIIACISKEFNFHMVKLNINKPDRNILNIDFYSLPATNFTKNILARNLSKHNLNIFTTFYIKAIRYLYKKFLCYPDIWIYEHDKIIENLNKRINKKFDIILVSIKPFSNAILANRLRKNPYLKDSKIVLDIGDPLAHNSINKTVDQKDINFEKNILDKAHKIIVTNVATKVHYIDTFQQDSNKIVVIPQGVNLNLFSGANNSPDILQNKNLSLIYAGSFYPTLRDPKNFFTALKLLPSNSNIKVNLYAGNIKVPVEIKNRVNVYEKINQQKLIHEYNQNNILLFFDNAYGIQTSGKIFELLALRKIIFFIYDNDNSPLKNELELENYSNIIFIKNCTDIIFNRLLDFENAIDSFNIGNYDLNSFSWKNRSNRLKKLLIEIED